MHLDSRKMIKSLSCGLNNIIDRFSGEKTERKYFELIAAETFIFSSLGDKTNYGKKEKKSFF